MKTTFTVEEVDNGYIISESIVSLVGITHMSSSVAHNKPELIEQIAKRLEADNIERRYRDEDESSIGPVTTGICCSENGLKEYEYTYYISRKDNPFGNRERALNEVGSDGWRFIGIDELDQNYVAYWLMREKETK